MSAEGDENLDNDAAQDMLLEISKHLYARILFLLRHPRGHEYDDQEIGELFVAIEVLFALNKSGLIKYGTDPTELKAATSEYLPRWEAYHRHAGHEPPEARKESIEVTFKHLNEIAEDFEKRRVHWRKLRPDELGVQDKTIIDILNRH